MNITIELTQEQQDAIEAAAARCNRANGEEWLRLDVLAPAVATAVADSYNAALLEIGETAKVLSYPDRLALIAQVRASLPNPPQQP